MNPYKQMRIAVRMAVLEIYPEISLDDLMKIDVKFGPKPWDMSTNAAFVLSKVYPRISQVS